MKKVKIFFSVVFSASLISITAIAQPEDPSQDPDVVPISGVEILLGAGALVGIKRLWDKRKED